MLGSDELDREIMNYIKRCYEVYRAGRCVKEPAISASIINEGMRPSPYFTRCPKRRVVLNDGTNDYRYGINCAALKLHGDKSRLSANKVIRYAKAASYVERQIAKFGKAEDVLRRIADTVTSYYVPCWVESGEIRMA